MPGPIDAELLGRLLDEQGPALALFAAQWTDTADDCVQEALVELAGQPSAPANLRAWLYRVVKNRALNAARGEHRRRVRERRAAACRLIADESTAFDRWDAMAVVESLDRLEDIEREIVVMRIWGTLTFEEIADALGTSTSTAFRQFERALIHLRQILEIPCTMNQNVTKPN